MFARNRHRLAQACFGFGDPAFRKREQQHALHAIEFASGQRSSVTSSKVLASATNDKPSLA